MQHPRPPDLVIYNAQHEELLDELVPFFEEESGLDVELRSGKDLEMANQIVEEGERLPRRRLPHRELPRDEHRRQRRASSPELPEAATADHPASSTSPADRHWTGFLARSTVVMYNTDTMTEADMPA